MHLKISSPEAVLFEGTVEKVTLPSGIGDITILPGHQPLSTVLHPGMVLITSADDAEISEEYVIVSGQIGVSVSKGLVMVDGDSIVMTTSVGVSSPSQSHEVLQQMHEDLQKELDQIKAEGNKENLEAAVMNLEKVTADLRMAKFGRV